MHNAFPVSRNVAAMKGSTTLIAAQKAAELRSTGADVIDLSVGEPDFDTPAFIQEYAIEGMRKGLTRYTPVAGLAEFRDAITSFYASQFGADVHNGEVAAACGGKQALFNAVCSLVDPGDDVLIPKPYWVSFPEIAIFCGARPVFIDTGSTDFVLSVDQVEASITEKTRLLILNSPNNPTGRVIPPADMNRIVELCAAKNIYVLTDECYLFFAYPPANPFSSASLPRELREFVCVAGTFSKTYAMTGWRIGYTIANPEWTKAMIKLQSHSATHPTSFVQYACAKAMEDITQTLDAVSAMTSEYERRKNWFIPALNAIEGFKCSMPEGAFYAFVDVREMLGREFKTSDDIAAFLLREAHVVVTDGEGFGADGFLRFSYATSMSNLEKAIERIKSALSQGTGGVANV